MNYRPQVLNLLESSRVLLSTLKPSEWNEQNRVMTTDVSPFPGKFSYERTPYLKEVVDCLSPEHPARIVSVMKGAQIGFSTGVIEAGIGWIISQNPCNILFLTGHSDLVEEAMNGKIDQMIDSCGLRPMIRPNVLRAKNMRTGDTNKSKEFPGGSLVAGSAGNHKLLRQRSVRIGFIDDFDAAKSSSKESGSTTRMIEQRFAAYSTKMKLFYISTPELKQTSNIEPVYLLGDQRRYHIPCPCCGEFIALHWSVAIDGDVKEKAGITWKLDDRNKLVEGSVGYICQKCAGFFTDNDKYELNLAGFWKPTSEPSQLGYYSYHISSLYAPPGMYDWQHYVRQYLEANPPEGKQKDSLQKTFVNLCLGETYEEKGEAPKANQLQKNIRNYEIGIVPEKQSMLDGNGQIVLITCGSDLNGTVDDARLDYEIVAWSETGSSYSVVHGSIGTFIPREGSKKNKEDRERWTYEPNKPNSVWKEFEKILMTVYSTDTGKQMRIFLSGVDCGHYTNFAYAFIDGSNASVVGLKGKDVDKYVRFGIDVPSFKVARERGNLFLVEVNQVKDEIAELIKLKHDPGYDDSQPPGFMNFPTPSKGLYLFNNFFSHYEAEHRIIENKDGEGIAARWEKKSSVVMNHMWDVRVYNHALRDIWVSMICKELKIKNYSWADYVDVVLNRR
jgi:phage terminase large subunit GpA-like protein